MGRDKPGIYQGGMVRGKRGMNEKIKKKEDGIMTGVIEKCTKHRAQFFFIRGDDGKRYFGHRNQIVNKQDYKYYCYEGNRVRFIPGELPEKEGDDQTADSIEFEKVDKYDRLVKTMRKVVVCKDCKKRNISECPLHYGGHTENDTDDDWFCADGVKKDG